MGRFCHVCCATKTDADFYDRLDKRGRPAVRECRDCYRRRLREAYRPIKERVDALKLATGCMDCGYNAHPEALEFDHRPGVVKVAAISVLVVRAPWAEIEAEIEKCDLVCANCHRVRTSDRQDYKKNAGWERVLRGLDGVTGLPLPGVPDQLPFGEAV